MTRLPFTTIWGEAPAKVNLALAVTGRRGDGYHTLRSVFLRLTLHDHLEVRHASVPEGEDELVISGDTRLAVDDNLVLRAARSLRDHAARSHADGGSPAAAGERFGPLRFRLEKHVPVAAGLAGGSSDAATALRVAAEAWGIRLEPATLLELAAGLGADVPFFAAGHAAALVESVGERVEGLPAPYPPAGILLATPASRLSTPAVFAELDRHDAHGVPGALERTVTGVEELAAALQAGLSGVGLTEWAGRLRQANDLWPAAARLSPQLAPAREALETVLDRPVLLTGSGPTLAAVYPAEESAVHAARQLEEARPAPLRDAAIIVTTTATRGGDP